MFPSQTKILIADDMAMFRAMVKQTLMTLDYRNVTETNDGVAAWAAIQKAIQDKAPFQMIISDWSMPQMKGIELLKKVRAESWGKNFPFILLTGEAEKQNIVEAIQAGVTQYMLKPFTVADMKGKLKLAFDKVNSAPPPADPGPGNMNEPVKY